MIDKGADIDGPPGTASNALLIAARENNADVLKVLVENGADFSLKCKLKWAENRTAQGWTELEKRRKAAAFLAGIKQTDDVQQKLPHIPIEPSAFGGRLTWIFKQGFQPLSSSSFLMPAPGAAVGIEAMFLLFRPYFTGHELGP